MAYKEYQQKVIVEYRDVDNKQFNLGAYLKEHGAELDAEMRELMEKQYDIMGEYIDILKKRIAIFDKENIGT